MSEIRVNMPGWIDLLIRNNSLALEYKEHLVTALEREREKMDTDDNANYLKARGAVIMLKEQINFLDFWLTEKERKK